MLEHVMIAAMPLNPSLAHQPRHHIRPVGFGFRHGKNLPMRKYWRNFERRQFTVWPAAGS
jgi:hypothetical protein